MRAVRSEIFDLILVDLNYTRDTTSGKEGMDLLSSLEKQGNHTPVMVMTAWSNFDLAVEAMRRAPATSSRSPGTTTGCWRRSASRWNRSGGKSELEIAANVQQKLFPRNLRLMRTVDYAGHCVAAREVGGDYYDFLEIADHTLGFVLADVSGKGVPAALLMANLQASFRNQPPGALLRPADVLEAVNRHFFDSTAAERFATLFFGIYDDRHAQAPLRELRACLAADSAGFGRGGAAGRDGHDAGRLRALEVQRGVRELRRGDTLLVYSDGVTEAGIEQGDEFGDERLEQVLRENAGGSGERAGAEGRRGGVGVQRGVAQRRRDGRGAAGDLSRAFSLRCQIRLLK